MISEPLPFAEVVAFLKQKKTAYPETELIPLIWEAIMGSVDWSRKPEQYEEQALKQAKVSPFFFHLCFLHYLLLLY